MKEKLINLKNTVVNFYKANKKIVLIALAVILVLIIALIIGTGKEEYGNTYGNLRNKGIVAAKGNQIYYVAFDEGNVDGIYKAKKNKGKKRNNNRQTLSHKKIILLCAVFYNIFQN